MQNDIKIFLVGNDVRSICETINLLPKTGSRITAVADNYADALILLAVETYDAVLLDMPQEDSWGSDLQKVVTEKYSKPCIHTRRNIECQGGRYDKAALPGAVSFDVAWYMAELQRMTKKQEGNETERPAAITGTNHCFIKVGDRYKKVDWRDVVYIRSENRYTCIFTSGEKKEYAIRSSLAKTMHDIIPGYLNGEFIQINRAEAVQVSYIIEFSGDEVKTQFKTFYMTKGYGRQLKAKVLFLA